MLRAKTPSRIKALTGGSIRQLNHEPLVGQEY